MFVAKRVCNFVPSKQLWSMLKYYKQEIRDLRNPESGKVREVYKLKFKHSVTGEGFMNHIRRHSHLGRGLMEAALIHLISCLGELLAENGSVTIPELGTFSIGIRPKKEKRKGLVDPNAMDEDSHGLNASSIEFDHINFRPSKHLMLDVESRLGGKGKFYLVGGREGFKLRTPIEPDRMERFRMAREFLANNPFMHVADYAGLTGLSYSTAQRELSLVDSIKESGIMSKGRRSHRVYVLRPANEPQAADNPPQEAPTPMP